MDTSSRLAPTAPEHGCRHATCGRVTVPAWGGTDRRGRYGRQPWRWRPRRQQLRAAGGPLVRYPECGPRWFVGPGRRSAVFRGRPRVDANPARCRQVRAHLGFTGGLARHRAGVGREPRTDCLRRQKPPRCFGLGEHGRGHRYGVDFALPAGHWPRSVYRPWR